MTQGVDLGSLWFLIEGSREKNNTNKNLKKKKKMNNNIFKSFRFGNSNFIKLDWNSDPHISTTHSIKSNK